MSNNLDLDNSNISNVPKKRGRKPKNKIKEDEQLNNDDGNMQHKNNNIEEIINDSMDINEKLDDNDEMKQQLEYLNNENEIKNINQDGYENGDEIKEKKKRGRKPKPKPDVVEVKIPKKRGRKPKPKSEEDQEPKVLKKRGRRPKDKIYSIIKNSHPMVEVNDNIILHLPVKTENLNNEDEFGEKRYLKYNPVINDPEPWEPSLSSEVIGNDNENPLCINNFQEINQNNEYDEEYESDKNNNNYGNYSKYQEQDNISKEYKNKLNICNSYENQNDYINDTKNLLNPEFVENENANANNNFSENSINSLCISESKFPNKTDIHCWWCCHGFESCPIGLPYKYEDQKFHIYGVFCSFNCACSYNFNDNDIKIWERFSLLNLLYKKVFKCSGINNKVKMAPPRQVLKKFGGYLSIEEFRKNCQNNDKSFKILMPPVISIIPQIEESNTIGNFDKSIPIDSNKIKKADLNLKLRRLKPIINPNRTLESYMK